MAREGPQAAAGRLRRLGAAQAQYPRFVPFMVDGMEFLGFSSSDIQQNIAEYMECGPDDLMVMAQRGEAKTTIAALFACWCLLHAPAFRILIVSAGGKMANEISTLITRLMLAWDVLEPLRPDRAAGDRTSTEAFDVHHTLKGPDKSPSVSCCGITAQLPGKRADLLIADDVESPKNSMTAGAREILLHLTREFSSIVVDGGRTLWLGTPQSGESVYNTLPGRGTAVRIWPGRFPTPEQLPHYGDMLAPLIRARIEANPALQTGGGPGMDQGQPTDPLLRSEQALVQRELQQGTAHFQLQFMLNTKLLDAQRYPLKPEHLIVMRLGADRVVPANVSAEFDPSKLLSRSAGSFSYKVSLPGSMSAETLKIEHLAMYIDPGGGGANGDETGYAIGGVAGGTLYALDVGGIKGGFEPDTLKALAGIAARWNVQTCVIEKNFGHGSFRHIFQPLLHAAHPGCAVLDHQVSGQKETRIINTLEPILGRRALVMCMDVLESDWASASKYGGRLAVTYSLLFQLARITREKGALVHDDRLDALTGLAQFFQKLLVVDAEKQLVVAQARAWKEMTRDPLNYNRYRTGPSRKGPALGKVRR